MQTPVAVSVVIPLYNAIHHLPALIEALHKQTLSHKLVLIDSGSTDGTCEFLQERNITFLSVHKNEFNHGQTRNTGVQMTDADWVIFMTQDAIPTSEKTFENLLSMRFLRDDIALIYGRQLANSNTGLFGRLARQFHYGDESTIKDQSLISRMGIRTCSCSNSFAAYRIADFKAVDQFPTDTILGEDVTVAARLILAGKAIGYCANSTVYHAHDYTIWQEFKRYFDIGAFHKQQEALLSPFTRAEGEGLHYAIQETRQLIREKQVWRIPEQLVRLVGKYVGYRLGKGYKLLPKTIISAISMHPDFWQSIQVEWDRSPENRSGSHKIRHN